MAMDDNAEMVRKAKMYMDLIGREALKDRNTAAALVIAIAWGEAQRIKEAGRFVDSVEGGLVIAHDCVMFGNMIASAIGLLLKEDNMEKAFGVETEETTH